MGWMLDFFMQPDPILSPWYVITNPQAFDERITMQSGAEKYALVFTQPATAKAFLRDLQDPTLILEELGTWVFKETFLSTLAPLNVTRVMFDYVQGQHQAMSAPLKLLRQHCKAQIGLLPRAVA